MSVRGLAEGIILQSMDDLWDEKTFMKSIEFFKGADFTKCASLAKMGTIDQIKLLNMVHAIIDNRRKKQPARVTNTVSRQNRYRSLAATAS